MTGHQAATRDRAWKCTTCLRLTIRSERAGEPTKCDKNACPGQLTEITLRRAGSRR